MTRAQFTRYCLVCVGIGPDPHLAAFYPKYPRKPALLEEVRPWLEGAR